MIGLLALLPGFFLKLATSGVLESVLDHKRKMADTQIGLEKIKSEKEIKTIEAEVDRRKRIAELQALEYQHWALWWPKMLICLSAALYVFARFTVKTWGLDDFNVAVAPLDVWEQGIVAVVTSYYFLKS